MAITQVTAPASVPAAIADYQAQNAHISAFNLIVNNQPFILTNSENTSIPAIAIGSYIQFGGNLYIVDTEDYAITGTPVDGNNYIRISGTTTLTAEWIQDISSYVWNPVYGYKYTGSYAILPYLVVKASTEYEKYSMGAVTVQYKMNQNVRNTDDVTFAKITCSSVNTGQGHNPVNKTTYYSANIGGSGDYTYSIPEMAVFDTYIYRLSGRKISDTITIYTPSTEGLYLVKACILDGDTVETQYMKNFDESAVIYTISSDATLRTWYFEIVRVL